MAERWLVIDDSSTIQRVIKLAFQGYDVHITEADSIQDAAREMMANQPSLVIADAALGGVQGVQDFLSLKDRAPQAPFIILEGSYDNIDEAQFRAAGFKHFLKKPFDGSQLLNITRQALGRALPYRGEAAIAAQAGAPQPTMAMPPPPPPLRKTMAESSFPPESTSTGFDLGLHDQRAPDPRAIAQTLVSTVDPRYAQTQMSAPPGYAQGIPAASTAAQNAKNAAPDRGFGTDRVVTNPHGIPAATPDRGFSDRSGTNPHGTPAPDRGFNDRSGTNPHGMPAAAQTQIALDIRGQGAQFSDNRGTNSGVESSGEFRQLPDSQAKGDTRAMIAAEARAMASAHLNAMSQSGNFGRKENGVETLRNPVSFSLEDDDPVPQPTAAAHWDGPRPAGSHLGNLLEPMLQEEMEKIVRVAVEDYCRKHFAGIARELIQRELDRLTQDRSRLLMD